MIDNQKSPLGEGDMPLRKSLGIVTQTGARKATIAFRAKGARKATIAFRAKGARKATIALRAPEHFIL